MTTLYPFGHLIDPDDDAATVLRTFGHLFDGDEGEDPDPEPVLIPAIQHHLNQLRRN